MERGTKTKHHANGPMIIRSGFELICAVWIHTWNVETTPSVQKFSPVLLGKVVVLTFSRGNSLDGNCICSVNTALSCNRALKQRHAFKMSQYPNLFFI